MYGTYANAQYCGEICDFDFWSTATPTELSNAIAGADVNARTEDGRTPLHYAASFGTPENIIALLNAGADVNARTE
ncbi:ankyrin repeat domain-containing protein, partial [Marivivens sp.]|uniref:ankyrin repeat domain-containing protein n=1 Tax=Marivivens sp. TaxID=1978374 RepID=UPI0025C17F60